MKRINNNDKFINLRRKFDFFEYQSYKYYQTDGKIIIEFSFNISNEFFFKPKLEIELQKSAYQIDNIPNLSNIVFNLGMIELISYWKTACPSKIIVRPHRLNEDQVQWWKKLYFNGLGEFFYLNNIEATESDFVEILSEGEQTKICDITLNHKKVIVPIGGGKDSVVSLEILKQSDFEVFPMMLNPGAAGKRTVETAGNSFDDSLIVKRYLDPKLIEMNAEGYLNGHTPFSALLAFTNVLLVLLTGIGNIALSNENSANESTVPGTKINHQYSKSFEFERDFDTYVKKYIHAEINYFSFLRPLNELQIARLFSDFIWHFESFRSCNVGNKKDEWCGSCPKCLFTFIILSPFIDHKTLTGIFKKNLLNDMSLKPILMELTGKAEIKPFECVGTVNEVNEALQKYKMISSERGNEANLLYEKEFSDLNNSEKFENILSEFNQENNLPDEFLSILKSALYD